MLFKKDMEKNEYILQNQQIFTNYLYDNMVKPLIFEHGENFKFESKYKLYMATIHDEEFYHEVKEKYDKVRAKHRKHRQKAKKVREEAAKMRTSYASQASKVDNDKKNRFANYCKKVNGLYGIDHTSTIDFKYVPHHKLKETLNLHITPNEFDSSDDEKEKPKIKM